MGSTVAVSRIDADAVVSKGGVPLPTYSDLKSGFPNRELDALRSYWMKEWLARNVVVEKGNDLRDEATRVIILAKDLEAVGKRLEQQKVNIFEGKVSLLIDYKDFKFENGFCVLNEPIIELAPPELAAQSNMLHDGIRPLYAVRLSLTETNEFVGAAKPQTQTDDFADDAQPAKKTAEVVYQARGLYDPVSRFCVQIMATVKEDGDALIKDLFTKLGSASPGMWALVSALLEMEAANTKKLADLEELIRKGGQKFF